MRDKSKPPCIKTGNHTFDEITHFKKCTECGQFMPYRTEEDKKYRGEMGVVDDHSPVVKVSFDDDGGADVQIGDYIDEKLG